MQKLKSHRGMKKRIKVCGTKKLMRYQAWKGHLATKKSSNRKRRLRRKAGISSANLWAIKKLIGK
ncbi:TPA: 50S ribosomal protein L35 [bacterium]|nr:50S ribosomal protein L35 [bacterium]